MSTLRKSFLFSLRNFLDTNFGNTYPIFVLNNALNNIEDCLLVSLVYFFYQENFSGTFTEYLDNLSLKALQNKAPEIVKIIQGTLNCIDTDLKTLNAKHEPFLVGDLHPDHISKYKVDNSISYYSVFNFETFISEVSKTLLPEYSEFLPSYRIESNPLITRKYYATNTVFKTEKQLQEYYFKMGFLIPFLLLLRATDINADNFIIHNRDPKVIDLEALFCPDTLEEKFSLHSTGIIRTNKNYDQSVLSGGYKEVNSLLKPILKGTNIKPKIVWKVRSNKTALNIPIRNGRKQSYKKYIKQIKEGYLESSTILLKRIKVIADFMDSVEVSTRIIVRPTKLYKMLLQKYCYPQVYLKNGNRRNFFIQELANYSQIYPLLDFSGQNYEADCLSHGLIPVFWSNIKSKEIFTSEGKPVGQMRITQNKSFSIQLGGIQKFFSENLKLIK